MSSFLRGVSLGINRSVLGRIFKDFWIMDGKLKAVVIIGWIICVTGLHFLFSKYLPGFSAFFDTELGGIVIILLSVVLSAVILQMAFQYFLRTMPEHIVETAIPGIERSPEEALVGALNDWSIYGVRLHSPMQAHTFLSRKKADWLADYVSLPEPVKEQMMSRCRIADQKLYAIKNDHDLKKPFSDNLLRLFDEKRLDYEVLLQDKSSFTEGGTPEKMEILETRDSLEALLGFVAEFKSESAAKKLRKDIAFEDDILKEAVADGFVVACQQYEIAMRPQEHWWWQEAASEEELG